MNFNYKILYFDDNSNDFIETRINTPFSYENKHELLNACRNRVYSKIVFSEEAYKNFCISCYKLDTMKLSLDNFNFDYKSINNPKEMYNYISEDLNDFMTNDVVKEAWLFKVQKDVWRNDIEISIVEEK
jgi:hypothetical protein